MAGTQPMARRANANGQLEVNAELAYLFDYYLAGLGERPLDAIRTEIIRELERRLRPRRRRSSPPAGRYLAYKRALVDVEHGLPGPPIRRQGARSALTAMQQLRSAYFTMRKSPACSAPAMPTTWTPSPGWKSAATPA
jgi:lipase chaperone LimK